MAANRILIAGGRGLVGRAAVEHFETRGWEVVGLARHGADFPTRAAFVQVDLRDRDACATAIGALRGVTHLVYAALYEKPDLASGWVDPAHIETNLTMLRNLMQPLRASCPDLQHVTLLQGTKAYGAHLGRMQVPAKERRPRVEHPNFYFAQEDWLRARQAEDARWALSILRPQIVCGVAIGAPMKRARAAALSSRPPGCRDRGRRRPAAGRGARVGRHDPPLRGRDLQHRQWRRAAVA
jgi:nucleoside-diphosphate-sugar epimerase